MIYIYKFLIFIGACLMVLNIIRYREFMSKSLTTLDQDTKVQRWRNLGFALLSFFLLGYLISLAFNVNLILALVLFFGSIFVSVMLSLLMEMLNTQGRIMGKAIDDAADTEIKTGMYNLDGFSRHASEVIRKHPKKQYMIVQWDLDDFKLFNDIYGFQAGDEVLKLIGQNSPKEIRNGIVFGHLESDHFVLLAEQTETSADEISAAIEHMLENLDKGNLQFHMGIRTVDDSDESVAVLCDHALIALRTIKTEYQKHYVWYDSGMRDTIMEERKLTSEMDQALAEGQFQPWYQPQVNFMTGKICSAEALVRWIHPERGMVRPDQFIPLFEKNGFITKLDHYIWEQVCIFQRDWIDSGHTAYPISINISRRDIFTDDLIGTITALTDKYKLDPSLLHLEITESVYMASPEKMNVIVDALQKKGFSIEMDDFGSGYSSLNTLKDMKVNKIKLDMKFLQHTENSDRSGRIISAMIRMADWLDVGTIAEGVETLDQADFLKSMGCFQLQGFYFYKPMPADEFRKLLEHPEIAGEGWNVKRKRAEGVLDFMDSSAQSTLVFNSFTGSAVIGDYRDGVLEVLRINDHLMKDVGPILQKNSKLRKNILELFEPDQKQILIEAMDRAVQTGEEITCLLYYKSPGNSQKKNWINVKMRVISSRGNSAVLYFSLQDITEHLEKEKLEAELQTIFQNIPGGIITFDLDDSRQITYRYISDYVYMLFHLDPEEYRSKENRKELDFGITAEMIEELLSDKKYNSHYFEQLYQRPVDNTSFWLHLEMRAQKENSEYRVYALLSDITARYENEMTKYAIMQAIPGGFIRYSCDEKEEVSFVSDGLLELYGYTKEEFDEKFEGRFSPMVYEEDRERVIKEIEAQIGNDGTGDMCKYRIQTKSGQLRWVYDAAYVTRDSDGRRWFNVVILDLKQQTDNDKWLT